MMNLSKPYSVRNFALLCTLLAICICAGSFTVHAAEAISQLQRSYFLSVKSFENYTLEKPATNSFDITLLSPVYSVPVDWDELVVSWNVKKGAALTMEARLLYADHKSHFYKLGDWSDDPKLTPRESTPGQRDADATVKTDTLVLKHLGALVQLRMTLHASKNGEASNLKSLDLSFCRRDAKLPTPVLRPNPRAWGKVIEVPLRRQGEYEGGGGWCSPTSLSMVLAYWSEQLKRPELNHTVPEVANAINDVNLPGTGNWPFNTAYAGEFDGMRAYVTRFDDVSELEEWIAQGIPVIVSISSYLTHDRHAGPDSGHLIVCVGFTENGDIITNDPGASVSKNESARRTYSRERFRNAWKKSAFTVYLVYPENKSIPSNPQHHWESVSATTAK